MTTVSGALRTVAEHLVVRLADKAVVCLEAPTPAWKGEKLRVQPFIPGGAPILAWDDNGSVFVMAGDRAKTYVDADDANTLHRRLRDVITRAVDEGFFEYFLGPYYLYSTWPKQRRRIPLLTTHCWQPYERRQAVDS